VERREPAPEVAAVIQVRHALGRVDGHRDVLRAIATE